MMYYDLEIAFNNAEMMLILNQLNRIALIG